MAAIATRRQSPSRVSSLMKKDSYANNNSRENRTSSPRETIVAKALERSSAGSQNSPLKPQQLGPGATSGQTPGTATGGSPFNTLSTTQSNGGMPLTPTGSPRGTGAIPAARTSDRSSDPAPGSRSILASANALQRQLSERLKTKTFLSSTGDVTAAMRLMTRAHSTQTPAQSAAMSRTLPTYCSAARTRAGGVNQEHEVALGSLNVGYGSSSIQGLRNYQEDTVAFLPGSGSLAGAVYDGHGGDQVSKELEKILLQNIMKGIGSLDGAQKEADGGAGPCPNAVKAVISKAYTETNKDLGLRLTGRAADAGSCAVTFLIHRAAGSLHLFCANAGDCRAVLYTGPAGAKRAVRLSEDHKPHPQVCPSEIRRVTSAGGCVLWGRVQGCLAVSRAFGDKTLQPYVIAEPFISVRPLDPEQDAFLYLVSDGVTDIIDDALGCKVVAQELAGGRSTAQAAAALVSRAYAQGSTDNISAVVVRLGKCL